MSSTSVQNYWINGQKAGEIAIDAAIAGDYGKPVIMTSGDDKACGEAISPLPWAVTAEVKRGLGCYYAMLLPPERARSLRSFSNAKPYIIAGPVRFRAVRCERIQLPHPARPYLTIIDGRTYEVEGSTMEEAQFRL